MDFSLCAPGSGGGALLVYLELEKIMRNQAAVSAGSIVLIFTLLLFARAGYAGSTTLAPYCFDFEDGHQGWTVDNEFGEGRGQWLRTNLCQAADLLHPDSGTDPDPTDNFVLRWGSEVSSLCTYGVEFEIFEYEGVVTSPSLNFSGLSDIVVTFNNWFAPDPLNESGTGTATPQIIVEASVDGANYSPQGTVANTSRRWVPATPIHLPASFDNQPDVRIRFRADMTFFAFAFIPPPANLGFNVDDIRITGSRIIGESDLNTMPPDVVVENNFYCEENLGGFNCNEKNCLHFATTDCGPGGETGLLFGDRSAPGDGCGNALCGGLASYRLWFPLVDTSGAGNLNWAMNFLWNGTTGQSNVDQRFEVWVCDDQSNANCQRLASNDAQEPPLFCFFAPGPQEQSFNCLVPNVTPSANAWLKVEWVNFIFTDETFFLNDFELSDTSCQVPAAPTGLSPADGATGQFTAVLCEWSDESATTDCALTYFLVIQEKGNPASRMTFSDISDTFYIVNGLARDTEYEWIIWAHTPDQDIPSDVYTFTTASGRPPAVTPVYPRHCEVGVAVTAEVEFDKGVCRCCDVLYGAAGDDFYTIDPLSLTATHVGSIGFFGVTGMTFGPDGVLYATARDPSFNDAVLITIDPATGAGTVIGRLDPVSTSLLFRCPDISCGPDGRIYGYGLHHSSTGLPNDLVLIDRQTGLATAIGPTSYLGGGNGMDFSPEGRLFQTPSFNGPAPSCLVEIDPATGAGQCIAGTDGKIPHRIAALEFCHQNGTLYGTLIANELVTIDPVTGDVTNLGLLQGLIDFDSMDALAFGCAEPITHDILFGTSNPPETLLESNITANVFDPSPGAAVLDDCTRYYWQVISRNSLGETVSEVFKFTTTGPVTQQTIPLGGADNGIISITPMDFGISQASLDLEVRGEVDGVSDTIVGTVTIQNDGDDTAHLTADMIHGGSGENQVILSVGGKTVTTATQSNNVPILLQEIGNLPISLEVMALSSDIFPSEPGLQLVFENPVQVELDEIIYAVDGFWVGPDDATLGRIENWDELSLTTQNVCIGSETPSEQTQGDFNNDGTVNLADFSTWHDVAQDCPADSGEGFSGGGSLAGPQPIIAPPGQDPNVCEALDLNEDGQINGADLGEFSKPWLDPNVLSPFGDKPYWRRELPNIPVDPNRYIPFEFEMDPNDPNGLVIIPLTREVPRVPPASCRPKDIFCSDICPLWINVAHSQSITNPPLDAYGDEFVYELFPPAKSYCTEIRVVTNIPNGITDPNLPNTTTDITHHNFCCDGNSFDQSFARILGFDILTDCGDSITLLQTISCRRKDSNNAFQKIQDINVTWSRSLTGEIKVEVEAIRDLDNNTTISQTVSGSQQGPACN
jgi:hypothetical protein